MNTKRTLSCVAFFVAAWSGARADAQVNLPPPPPPPLGTEAPAPTGPTSGGPTSGGTTRKPRRESPSPRESKVAPPVTERIELEEPSYSYRRRIVSVRANPLALFIGRLSVDAEWMVAPHHALVGSPHVTLAQDRGTLPANATGFTNPNATGFGVELGYHYFLAPELEGLFFGPSLLVDSTRPTPGGTRFTAYGGAFDVGYQAVVGPGFTLAAGGGLLFITASGAPVKLAPRVLLGVGWTF